MKPTDKKKAEKFYEEFFGCKFIKDSSTINVSVIRFAEEYHQSRMEEVTDEMIEKWADEIYGTIHVSGSSLALRLEAIKGAKAFRDGKIINH